MYECKKLNVVPGKNIEFYASIVCMENQSITNVMYNPIDSQEEARQWVLLSCADEKSIIEMNGKRYRVKDVTKPSPCHTMLFVESEA
jgi:hypothetical protein